MQVLFATGNARKLGEARLGCAPFGIAIEPVAVHFQELLAQDPVEIARHKSRQAFDQIGEPLVVADTFWAIPALNGFPGAYMKEVTRWFRPEDFINLLRPYDDRRICLYETVVYRDANQERVFAGVYWGEIVDVPRGDGLPIEEVAAFNGQTIAERRNKGKFSHDPEEFVWVKFAAWYAGLHGVSRADMEFSVPSNWMFVHLGDGIGVRRSQVASMDHLPATVPARDHLEARLADLIPLVELDISPRGRPPMLAAGLIWGALLTSVLHGGSSLRGVWRRIATTGLWAYPAVGVSDEAVRSRLLAQGPEPFATLFAQVTTTLQAEFTGDDTLVPAFPGGVYAMDTTTLDRVAKPLRTDAGPYAALAGRLHTLFDVRRQLFTAVIPVDLPTQSEQVAAPDLIATLPTDSLLLMDRGYTNYPRFDAMTADHQAFVTRLRENASFTSRWVLTDTAVVRDEEVWLGKHRADRCAYPFRVITIRVGTQTRRYLTNVLSPDRLSPAEVERVYRRRWDIERAFKTIKQDLGLATLWATRWELILIQIWATLIIAQVASAVRQEVAQRAAVPVDEVSLQLLLEVLPRMAAQAHHTGEDVLDLVVARGRKAELIRPVRRGSLAIPPHVPWQPPPATLPTMRVPRYARKP